MQVKHIVWSCAVGLFLALASVSYAADTPEEATAGPPPAEVAANPSAEAAADPPMTMNAPPKSASQPATASRAVASAQPTVTNPGQIYLIRENPFFNLHIEKAVNHAREAEIAGNMGESEVLLEQARLSLMRAREAQRAGNVPGLNEGIANLKQALNLNTWLTQGPKQTSLAETPQAAMPTTPAEMSQSAPQTSAEMSQTSTVTSSPQVTGQKSLSDPQRTDAALRSATDAVREARKNLSEAGGLKYKEIQPQIVKTAEK